ncbi:MULTISPECIES: glycosyltransferase family 32 protein [unclassified Sphingobacterium]|uniref:glycosyltransferase family 32 protein n=1 Tax=unclassified Sphingobacterium TaxID=2609468 RepID=UPI0020C45D45|nr:MULTISPECIES: capsular polysaccharide synthesis protein [unclassified Sphingobacterium]
MPLNLSKYPKVLRCLAAGYSRRIFNLPLFSNEEAVIEICQSQERRDDIPKLIWIYWEEDELPQIVKGSVEKIIKLNPDFEVKVLSSHTIKNYLPDFYCHAEVPIPNKTDLMRLELLFRYGGVWMDATIILQESLNWIYQEPLRNKYDVIGYYRSVNTYDNNFPVIETWFLASQVGNKFIKDWLDVLSPLRDMGSPQYFKMLQEREDYAIIQKNIEPPSYLLVYLACQIAQRNTLGYNLYLRKAEANAFFLQNHYEWNSNVISYALTRLDASQSNYKLIKLTSGDRSLLSSLEELRLINKRSFIGQLLN